jgi:hypothetical protein
MTGQIPLRDEPAGMSPSLPSMTSWELLTTPLLTKQSATAGSPVQPGPKLVMVIPSYTAGRWSSIRSTANCTSRVRR